MRWGVTARTSRFWGSRNILRGARLVPRSLFGVGVGVVCVRRGRVETRLLRGSRGAVVARRVDIGNVILGSVCLVGSGATIATALPAAGGCGRWLRGGLTHGFKGDGLMTWVEGGCDRNNRARNPEDGLRLGALRAMRQER